MMWLRLGRPRDSLRGLTLLSRRDGEKMTTMPEPVLRSQEDIAIDEKKRVALAYLSEAWDGAISEGVDSEIFAHAALFTALSDLVLTYGEEAVAGLAETLPRRVRALEFSLNRIVQ
jgi:hypothetical protein